MVEHERSVDITVSHRPERRLRTYAAAFAIGGLVTALAFPKVVESIESIKDRLFGELNTVEQVATAEQAAIKLMEPIALDCRVMTVMEGKNEVSVIRRFLGRDMGRDLRVETEGVVEQLTCIDAASVPYIRVEGHSNGSQTVRIPADKVRFFSRINELKTKTVTHSEPMDNIGRGAAQWLTAISPWNPQDGIAEGDAEHMQVSRAHLVNTAHELCGPVAWEWTKQAIEEGYRLAAEGQGIDPQSISVKIDGTPQFKGEYEELPGEYEYRLIDKSACLISEEVRDEFLDGDSTSRTRKPTISYNGQGVNQDAGP